MDMTNAVHWMMQLCSLNALSLTSVKALPEEMSKLTALQSLTLHSPEDVICDLSS